MLYDHRLTTHDAPNARDRGVRVLPRIISSDKNAGHNTHQMSRDILPRAAKTIRKTLCILAVPKSTNTKTKTSCCLGGSGAER
jgi:hypothetical protein